MKEEGCGYILEKMTLIKLLKSISIFCEDERIIKGITDDSRKAEKDWLFVCKITNNSRSDIFIQEVLDKGGVVLKEGNSIDANVYTCDELESKIPTLLSAYYGDIQNHMTIIGVTGTNGKSSVTDILKQLLCFAGKKVMTIGTDWITTPEKKISIDNTTPSMFMLAYYFHYARNHDITHIIMEVSSHAIDQKRIKMITYDFILYTNITRDHLDYHITLTHYQYTKFKLQKYLKPSGLLIINNDDTILETIYKLSDHKCITIGTKEAHFPIRDIRLKDNESSFTLHNYEFHTNLLSVANVYNIVQAIALCRCMKISYVDCQNFVKRLEPVKGRLQCIKSKKFTIWIDYAHTSMAVQNLIDFANSVKEHNVIIVIGCGGEREIEKRSEIGEYCANHCDYNIFTSDNPRSESIDKILLDMTTSAMEHIKIIENRFYAIKHAIKMAEKSDIIIIAGKGNEETQTIREKKYPFHDETCVYKILEKEDIPWY